MKDPKLTKKELAAQTRELEEEVTRLKNRLNGQVFKKTKHGFRLDQLSEGAQQLNGRIGELEQQLAKFSKMQDELTEKWQELGKDTEILKTKTQKPGGKKRLKEQLGKLKSGVADLSLRQQQTGKTLSELQSAVGRVGSVRDDLKLETDELRSQVRNLEENSSRLSVNQSSQEARTRELEGLLAELTLRQQSLAAENEAGASKIRQQLAEKIAPIRSQLQQLGELTPDENGRHKEVDRRLQELANRVGDLGGRFNHLSQDVSDQRQHRERQQQELNPRLQQLEARTSAIDALETRLNSAFRRETDALWQKLEEEGNDLSSLRERLDALPNRGQSPELDQKLSGVEAEVSRLSAAEDFLQESFRGLGGLELNLTSRLDDLQQQLQEHIARSRESEEAIHRLAGELVEMGGNLQKQLDQSDLRQQNRIEALEQRLGAESAENPDNHGQEVDAQLDRIEEAFTAERERIFQLEEHVAHTRDQSEAQKNELQQGRLLQEELQSRLEGLNKDVVSQTELSGTLAAGLEQHTGQQRALADKLDEQAREQQALSARVDGHAEQQSVLLKETESVKEALSALEQREQQSASQSAGLKQEQRALRLQLEAEKPKIEEHTQTLQALTTRCDTLQVNGEAQQLRIEKSESSEKAHRIALFALLLLGLLGGLALFFSNAGKIAESEQLIAQKLTSPDPRYITREDLSEKLHALEIGLAGNSEKILAVEKALPPQTLWERQIGLEQQLARFEVRLNLLTAGAGRAVNATGEPPEADIGQLKEQQDAIAKIERSLTDTRKVYGERLNELETEGANSKERFRQLQFQVQALAVAQKTPERAIVSPDKTDAAAIWQAAADARRYAVQLAGSRSKSSLIAFMSGRPEQKDTAYFRTVHEGREWYILLHGPYNRFRDASNALESLPAALKRYSPWIRRISKDAKFVD